MSEQTLRQPGDSPPPRVGFLFDGSAKGYGVFELTRSLVEALDRGEVTSVGLFLGAGYERGELAKVCDEVCDVGSGCLFPLSQPGRGKWYLPNLFRKAGTFLRAVRALARAIRRLDLDMVHVHSYPLHLVAGLACWWTGIPCLWHWHGSFSKRGVGLVVAWLGLTALAARIICISRFVADTFPASLRKKCTVVYDGVKTQEIRDRQHKGFLRQRLGIGANTPLVGIFGSLTVYKGHEYFLRAAASVVKYAPDVRFVVAGTEDEVQKLRYGREASLRQLVADLGISDRVSFVGHLENGALYMGDCDIICVPTVPLYIAGEGFGLVVVEAMAAGALVVSTNCGAPPEIIEDGVSGLLVPPWDPQALADAVLRLLRDPGCREAMRQAAWRRVHEHFDVGRMAAAMQAIYCEMARGGQGGVAGAALP
jgi:glycosyltransferase involved in cell wall biosynthesis